MKNLLFSLFLTILSMCGTTPMSNGKHQISPKDKAILRILQYRHLYMTQGPEKVKNDSYLTAITDELPGDLAKRIEHLKIHGIKPNSTREAAIRLAERNLVLN